MFAAIRNTALAAAAIGFALTGSARATVLVDFVNASAFGGIHILFETPTLLSSDTTSTFSLNVGKVSTFQYDLDSEAALSWAQSPRSATPFNLSAAPALEPPLVRRPIPTSTLTRPRER